MRNLGDSGTPLFSLATDETIGHLARRTENEDELDDGGNSLAKSRNAPRPFIAEELGTEGQPSDDQSSDVPETVVDSRESGAMLGMAKFGEQHGRRDLGERVTETKKGTTTHEHLERSAIVSWRGFRGYSLPMFWQAPWRAAPATMMMHPITMGILRPNLSAIMGLLSRSVCKSKRCAEELTLRAWRPNCRFGKEQQEDQARHPWGG